MRKFFTHNLPLKLFSLFLALILWASVKGGEEAEMELALAVEVVNIPSHLVVTSDLPKELRVKLRGPRNRLRRLAQVYPRLYPIDVSTAKPGWQNIPVRLAQQVAELPRGVAVVGTEPYLFRILFEEKRKKEVAVRLQLVGRPEPPYRLGQIRYAPRQVVVSGAPSALTRLEEVVSDPVDLRGAEHSVSGKVGLALPDRAISVEGPPFIEVNIEVVEEKS